MLCPVAEGIKASTGLGQRAEQCPCPAVRCAEGLSNVAPAGMPSPGLPGGCDQAFCIPFPLHADPSSPSLPQVGLNSSSEESEVDFSLLPTKALLFRAFSGQEQVDPLIPST